MYSSVGILAFMVYFLLGDSTTFFFYSVRRISGVAGRLEMGEIRYFLELSMYLFGPSIPA